MSSLEIILKNPLIMAKAHGAVMLCPATTQPLKLSSTLSLLHVVPRVSKSSSLSHALCNGVVNKPHNYKACSSVLLGKE